MSAETDLTGRARLADALARGANVTQAARIAGYTRVHADRLVNRDPEFQAMVARRRETLALAPATARELAAEDDAELARSKLRRIVAGEEEADMVTIAACKALLTDATTRRKPKALPQATARPPLKIADAAEAEKWLRGERKA